VEVPVGLVGCVVRRISVDYQVRLLLVGDGASGGRQVDAELMVETSFRPRDAAGIWHDLAPGTGSRLAPVLDLFIDSVVGVDVGQQGMLSLRFASGAELVVAPDPRFESWHVTGPGVSSVSVGPGGHDDWELPATQTATPQPS
jgi:hypothetical protein